MASGQRGWFIVPCTFFPALSQEPVSWDTQGRGRTPTAVSADRLAREPGAVYQESRLEEQLPYLGRTGRGNGSDLQRLAAPWGFLGNSRW